MLWLLWCIFPLQHWPSPSKDFPLYYRQEKPKASWFRGLTQGYNKLGSDRARIEPLSAWFQDLSPSCPGHTASHNSGNWVFLFAKWAAAVLLCFPGPRYCSPLCWNVAIENKRITKCWWGCEESEEPSYAVVGSVKCCSHFEDRLAVPQMISRRVTLWPSSYTPRLYPREMKTCTKLAHKHL